MSREMTACENRLLSLQKATETSDPEWIRINEERQRLEKRSQTMARKRTEHEQRLEKWTRHITLLLSLLLAVVEAVLLGRKLRGDLAELQNAHRRFEEMVKQEEGKGVRLSDEDLDAYHRIQNGVVSMTGRLQQEKGALDATQTTAVESLERLKSKTATMQSQIDSWEGMIEVLENKKGATQHEIKEVHNQICETEYEKRHLGQKIQEEAAKRDTCLMAVHFSVYFWTGWRALGSHRVKNWIEKLLRQRRSVRRRKETRPSRHPSKQ